MYIKRFFIFLCAVASMPLIGFAGIITINTKFAAATSVLTDGRGIGHFGPGPDTVDDWTFYTRGSTINRDLTVPFGLSSSTLGQQEIRVAVGSELEPNDFFLGFEITNFAIALRSQTFTNVVAGSTAQAVWNGTDLLTAKSFYSLDNGSNWSLLLNGAGFTVPTGRFEIVFVGNDGIDTTARIQTVAITYDAVAAVPEPSSGLLFSTAALGLILHGWRTRRAGTR